MRKLVLLIAWLLVYAPAFSQQYPAVKIGEFPPADRPPATFDAAAYKSSYKYYYGLGVPVNYKLARFVAFREFQREEHEEPFEGAAILMMLYANGFGVARNVDLAIRLACANVVCSPAEFEHRKEHLETLRADTTMGVFDICDDITSGYMEGFCQSLVSERREIDRAAELEATTGKWSAQEKAAFKSLGEVAETYFNTAADDEVDQSGTARAAMTLQAYDGLKDNYIEKIHSADSCSFASCSHADYKAADDSLNTVYKALMRADDDLWGTVNKEGIRATEQAWIDYRDAWISFMKTKCPQTPTWTLKTLLTRDRTEDLKSLVE